MSISDHFLRCCVFRSFFPEVLFRSGDKRHSRNTRLFCLRLSLNKDDIYVHMIRSNGVDITMLLRCSRVEETSWRDKRTFHLLCAFGSTPLNYLVNAIYKSHYTTNVRCYLTVIMPVLNIVLKDIKLVDFCDKGVFNTLVLLQYCQYNFQLVNIIA